MKKYLIGLLAVTACSPTTIIKPQEVKIAVPVACMAQTPPEPAWNAPEAAFKPFPEQVRALAADLTLAQGYIGTLEAALKGCRDIPRG